MSRTWYLKMNLPADDCCCLSHLTVLTEASLHFTAVAAAKDFAVISLYYNSDWNNFRILD